MPSDDRPATGRALLETAAPPAVSVVMPVHNGERFLAEAIDSILAQTYGDFEFIIVDDASNDGTPDILKDSAGRDPRVRVHTLTTNQGAAEARNHGCRHARGRFLAVMDADDVSLPHRFARQVGALESDGTLAAVGSWVRRIDESGAQGAVHTYPHHPALVAWSMVFFNSVAHPTLMVRRTALDPTVVYRSNQIEDYALLIPLTIRERVRNIPEVLLLYRVWPGSTTHKPGKDLLAGQILCDALQSFGIDVSPAQALALHGLAIDRYPSDTARIADLASVIERLHSFYSGAVARGTGEAALISRDAGFRLWMLAALAVRHSPGLSVSLMSRAAHRSPASFLTFAAKLGARAMSRRTRRRAP